MFDIFHSYDINRKYEYSEYFWAISCNSQAFLKSPFTEVKYFPGLISSPKQKGATWSINKNKIAYP